MEWGATRAQDLESRRRRGGGHERGDSRQKMFAVVEHEQHLLGTEMADQVPEDWTVNASRVLPTPPPDQSGSAAGRTRRGERTRGSALALPANDLGAGNGQRSAQGRCSRSDHAGTPSWVHDDEMHIVSDFGNPMCRKNYWGR
jgi:hypothetical protein